MEWNFIFFELALDVDRLSWPTTVLRSSSIKVSGVFGTESGRLEGGLGALEDRWCFDISSLVFLFCFLGLTTKEQSPLAILFILDPVVQERSYWPRQPKCKGPQTHGLITA